MKKVLTYIVLLSLVTSNLFAAGGFSSGGGSRSSGGGGFSSGGRSSSSFSSRPSAPAIAPSRPSYTTTTPTKQTVSSTPQPATRYSSPQTYTSSTPKTTTTTTTTTNRSYSGSSSYYGGGYNSRYIGGSPYYYGGMGYGYHYNDGFLTGMIIGNMMHPHGAVMYTGSGMYNNNALLYPDNRVVSQSGQLLGTYENGEFSQIENGPIVAQNVPARAYQKSVNWGNVIVATLLLFMIAFLIWFIYYRTSENGRTRFTNSCGRL